jgi:hypothetical protein
MIQVVMAGCESNDKRLTEFAERATAQQAQQNKHLAEQSQAVARQSQELTSAAHELVDKDAAARRELIQAQEKLQEQIHIERVGVDRQREELHNERKTVAAAAAREPLIAQALFVVGMMLAALLPLLVTAYAIRRLPESSAASELLVDDLLEDLLREHRARPQLSGYTVPSLVGPTERMSSADASPDP